MDYGNWLLSAVTQPMEFAGAVSASVIGEGA